MDYAGLLPFCETDRQREVIEALIEHGSLRRAAKALGCHDRRVPAIVATVRRHAVDHGYSPQHGMKWSAPPNFRMHAATVQCDGDGNVERYWPRISRPEIDREEIKAAYLEIAECVSGKARPVPVPMRADTDTMTVYPYGDPHIGAYAYAAEAGEDFDTNIARRDLYAATSRLVDASPPSHTAIIAPLGDLVHADSSANLTTKGTRQDVDTRWGRVFRVAGMLMADATTLALKKHQEVHVRLTPGNHDEDTSRALCAFLWAYFRNEPRVTVHSNDCPFQYHEFGKNLLGFTHGDKAKVKDLGGIMAADQPEAWGRTLHRHWLTGHIHSTFKNELHGCTQESFRTLAAREAWNNSMGYRSGRDMYAIVYDREDGEVERYRCDIRRARRAS